MTETDSFDSSQYEDSVDYDRFSVEQVLEIGRKFQREDRWHGAHYDTAKLLCDTIEKLYAEVQKCHAALETLNKITDKVE